MVPLDARFAGEVSSGVIPGGRTPASTLVDRFTPKR
jgi:hypothetical protein